MTNRSVTTLSEDLPEEVVKFMTEVLLGRRTFLSVCYHQPDGDNKAEGHDIKKKIRKLVESKSGS
jgi:hypothetical protein